MLPILIQDLGGFDFGDRKGFLWQTLADVTPIAFLEVARLEITTHDLLWAHYTKLDLLDLFDRRRGVRKCDRHGGVLSFCLPIASLFSTFTPVPFFLYFWIFSLDNTTTRSWISVCVPDSKCRTDGWRDEYGGDRMESEPKSGWRVFEAS